MPAGAGGGALAHWTAAYVSANAVAPSNNVAAILPTVARRTFGDEESACAFPRRVR